MDLFFVSPAAYRSGLSCTTGSERKPYDGWTSEPCRIVCRCSWTKNYRYSTNLQVVIDTNSRLVMAIDLPLPAAAMTAGPSPSPASTGLALSLMCCLH